MSSFLEKLRGGGVDVDNAAPADVTGALVRKVEKAYATQPFEQVGLTLSDDCEVLAVAPHSPAAVANVPGQSMVYECNGEFVETPAQLAQAAQGSLLLVLRMQSTTAMAELIARVLRDDEARLTAVGGGGDGSSGSGSTLDLQELLRTTPRYSFLSSEHPLFRRYTRRLSAKRDAMALIHQRMQEAEEQQRRDICARIARERDAALAAAEAEAQAQQRQQAAAADAAAAQERDDNDEHAAPVRNGDAAAAAAFVPLHDDEDDTSAFTQRGRAAAAQQDDEGVHEDTAAQQAAHDDGDATRRDNADTAPAAAVDASELLALVGLPSLAPPVVPDAAAFAMQPPAPVLQRGEGVSYVILPSEEYVLRNGDVVVYALKQRDGPLPRAPDGKPPKVNVSALQAMRAKYEAMLAPPPPEVVEQAAPPLADTPAVAAVAVPPPPPVAVALEKHARSASPPRREHTSERTASRHRHRDDDGDDTHTRRRTRSRSRSRRHRRHRETSADDDDARRRHHHRHDSRHRRRHHRDTRDDDDERHHRRDTRHRHRERHSSSSRRRHRHGRYERDGNDRRRRH